MKLFSPLIKLHVNHYLVPVQMCFFCCLMDFVHHVDIVGIRNVNHWALWWSSEETHEHECTNQTCSVLSFLGKVDNGMLTEENLLSILQQSHKRILAGVW